MNMPPKKSIATIKAKLQIAKTKMTSALDSFLKEIESENPNFIAINHYKNTVKQRLEDLEERTYEAIDETSEEEQTTQQTMKKITDVHRPNRTTAAQPQRQLEIIKQMQHTTKRIDKGHCQQHPQSIQLRMPQQITMEYHMT